MEYKIEKFTLIDLVVIALFSALSFSIGFVAQIFKLLPGGGELLLTAFFFPLFFVVTAFITRKFFTVFLLALIYATLALPTPLLTVPGILKYPLILPSAIAVELIFLLLCKHEKIASILSGGVSVVIINIVFLYIFMQLGLPGVELILATFSFFMIFGFIAGSIGGYMGYAIYKQIENKPFVKRLRQLK